MLMPLPNGALMSVAPNDSFAFMHDGRVIAIGKVGSRGIN